MPNTASARKELRKAIVRQARNAKVMSNLKDLIKQSRRAIAAKDIKAKELVAKTLTALDKAAKQGLIKNNTRDRNKSRLHQKFNQAFI